MEIDLITKQDLEEFRQELLVEIREIIKPEPKKKWLTSKDMREMLSISASSLQNLLFLFMGKLTVRSCGGRSIKFMKYGYVASFPICNRGSIPFSPSHFCFTKSKPVQLRILKLA